jgi:hypothetical protein
MRGGWLGAVIMSAACARPHVQMNPPQPGISADERVAMFNALAGKTEITTWSRTCNGHGCTTSVEKTLVLANGTEVNYPEDLLPILPTDCETVNHVRASQEAISKSHVWTIGAVAAATASIVLFAHGGTNGSDAVPLLFFGGAAIGAIGVYHYSSVATDEIGLAYRSYTKDLAERLAICAKGLEVVPCEE